MPTIRNKFVEIVAVEEHCSIMAHVKNKESKKQPFRIRFPVKLADGRISVKKGKDSFVPKLQYCHFGQNGLKYRNFQLLRKSAPILNDVK